MIPEIHISLVIEEEFIDDEVLDTLGKMGTTESWHENQLRENSVSIHKNSGCAFKAHPIIGWSVENAINHFWDHFKLEEVGLSSIVREHNLAPILSIAIYIDDAAPSIHLESSILTRLLESNIGLDIDIILSE